MPKKIKLGIDILSQPNVFNLIWDKVFKNGSSKICGRQPLKNLKMPILEYFVPDTIDRIPYQ